MRTAIVAVCLCALAATVLAMPWNEDTLIKKPEEECEKIKDRAPLKIDPVTGEGGVRVPATLNSTQWGSFWKYSFPYAVANSEDEVYIETLTHHGGDAYDDIVVGDPAMEEIYKWTKDEMPLFIRGATGKSDGAHIMTGPVWICGAEKGDVLQTDILQAEPRRNPATGKSFAINAAAWWGFHRRTEPGSDGVDRRGGYKTGDNARETITVYEALLDEGKDAAGNYNIRPVRSYQWWTDKRSPPDTLNVDGSSYKDNGMRWNFPSDVKVGGDFALYSNLTDAEKEAGQTPSFSNGASVTWCVPEGPFTYNGTEGAVAKIDANPDRKYGRGNTFPCDSNGYQYWNDMGYRGMLPERVTKSDSTAPTPEVITYYTPTFYGGSSDDAPGDSLPAWTMRARIHPGNIGVSRDVEDPTDSIPPGIWGGNIDNRRLNQGTSLYVPVQVKGALFEIGDSHFSQGDSEMDGTASEASVNYRLKFTLHKAKDVNDEDKKEYAFVRDLKAPLIETPQEFIIQAASYANYHDSFENGGLTNATDGTSKVFAAGRGGGGDLNKALSESYKATRDWMMMTYGWSEDLVLSAITMGVDFGVSQAVDGTWGMHAIIPKMFFPVPGHPEGPRNKVNELAVTPGSLQVVQVTVDSDLTLDEVEEGTANTQVRKFLTTVIESMKTNVAKCVDGAQCKVTFEILDLSPVATARRHLSQGSIDVQVTATVAPITSAALEELLKGTRFATAKVRDAAAVLEPGSGLAVRVPVLTVLLAAAVALLAWV